MLLHKWKSRRLLLLLLLLRHLIHKVELWLWLLRGLLTKGKTLIHAWLLLLLLLLLQLHEIKCTSSLLSTKWLIHLVLMLLLLLLLEMSLIHHATYYILKSISKLVLPCCCWHWRIWHSHHWLVPNHVQVFTFCV